MKITAKVRCNYRGDVNNGQVPLTFGPDYLSDEGKMVNAEWAKYTPALSISMSVLDSVPFKAGQAYTLTFDDGE